MITSFRLCAIRRGGIRMVTTIRSKTRRQLPLLPFARSADPKRSRRSAPLVGTNTDITRQIEPEGELRQSKDIIHEMGKLITAQRRASVILNQFRPVPRIQCDCRKCRALTIREHRRKAHLFRRLVNST